ncbi:hypothetical protein J2T13_004070 [Paenibacillus sp. DS2015]|uniref:M23 family metallopeptidase n=1 Tax=Paenibacillus sp. DS2015 TaxID=3373917 RepID=UPI003D1B766B
MRDNYHRFINHSGNYSRVLLGTSALVFLLSACGGEKVVKTNSNPASSNDQKSTTASTSPIESQSVDTLSTLIKPEELPQAMLSGNYSGIYAHFSASFKEQVSESSFADMASTFTHGIQSFPPSSVMLLNGNERRVWINPAGDKGIMALFDDKGTILGLQIMGLASYPETDKKKTYTVFELPFHGDWYVFWGGTNVMDNYHYEHESQRYAYDFVQEVDGVSYIGEPLKNESYYAFGQDIIAPADGIVITVVNDIADNEPVGVMNEKEPAGNVVIIDHGGEYSYLAHLKQGSATVKSGDHVKSGDVIGQLGNSGNSSEPHLHYQVSDGADLFASQSLNIHWNNDLNPVKGQTIQSPI